jgi:hypothetical protein
MVILVVPPLAVVVAPFAVNDRVEIRPIGPHTAPPDPNAVSYKRRRHCTNPHTRAKRVLLLRRLPPHPPADCNPHKWDFPWSLRCCCCCCCCWPRMCWEPLLLLAWTNGIPLLCNLIDQPRFVSFPNRGRKRSADSAPIRR